MKRQLWGEFSSTAEDAETLAKQNEIDQEIMDNKRGEIETFIFNSENSYKFSMLFLR